MSAHTRREEAPVGPEETGEAGAIPTSSAAAGPAAEDAAGQERRSRDRLARRGRLGLSLLLASPLLLLFQLYVAPSIWPGQMPSLTPALGFLLAGTICLLTCASPGPPREAWRVLRAILAVLLTLGAVSGWNTVTRLPRYQALALLGKPLPPFTLEGADGEAWDRDRLVREAPLVLVFYRDWCRFCQLELANLQSEHASFAERGVRLVGVSLSDAAAARATAERHPDLLILRDDRQELLDRLNLYLDDQRGEAARLAPTTILLDREGLVRYVHRPARVSARLSPGPLLALVERHLLR